MINNFKHEKETNSDRLCSFDQSSISGRIGVCGNLLSKCWWLS
jgi:hypothetical protein